MANYYASARSNYFRVKNPEQFEAWAKELGLEVWQREGFYALGAGSCEDSGGWPCDRYDDEKDEYTDLDLAAELAKHLIPSLETWRFLWKSGAKSSAI